MIKEILKRRSIRKYKKGYVKKEDILEIVKAGMNAPSARNKAPWEFIIVSDDAIKEEIIKINPFANMIENCDFAVVVLSRELSEFWVQDASAATQNMLLEATELGFGSCWIGIHTKDEVEEKLKNLLNVPEDVRVFSIVAVGKADETKDENNRYEEEKIHFEKW